RQRRRLRPRRRHDAIRRRPPLDPGVRPPLVPPNRLHQLLRRGARFPRRPLPPIVQRPPPPRRLRHHLRRRRPRQRGPQPPDLGHPLRGPPRRTRQNPPLGNRAGSARHGDSPPHHRLGLGGHLPPRRRPDPPHHLLGPPRPRPRRPRRNHEARMKREERPCLTL